MAKAQQYQKGAIVLSTDVPIAHVLDAIKYNYSAQQAYFKFSCNQACENNSRFIPVLEALLENKTFLTNFPSDDKEFYVQKAYNESCQNLIDLFKKHPDFTKLCLEMERIPTPEPELPRLPPILKTSGSFRDRQKTQTVGINFTLNS